MTKLSLAEKLFIPAVPTTKLHPHFLKILKEGDEPRLDVIRSWANGFEDRDGKFVKEFQISFNSSFWELYLFAIFGELGFDIDFSHSRPDFCMSNNDRAVIAEATVAEHTEGHRPEWDKDLSPEIFEGHTNISEVIRRSTIRIANSIWSKTKKYKSGYVNLEHVQDRPFVICVAPFDQPFFFLQGARAAMRVLYGIEEPIFMTDDAGRLIPLVLGFSNQKIVVKDTGSEVPLGFFRKRNEDRFRGISAVIFSVSGTMGKVRALQKEGSGMSIFGAYRFHQDGCYPRPIVEQWDNYHETLLDGLHVFVNPFADIPLDLEPFRDREIAIHNIDSETGKYSCEMPDNFLLSRQLFTIRPFSGQSLLHASPLGTYAPAVRPTWPKRELRPVDGQWLTCADPHIGHFNGWTVMVARDVVDDDWMGQTVIGTWYTLGEVFAAQRAASNEEKQLIPVSVKTKEEAFDVVTEWIEQVEE